MQWVPLNAFWWPANSSMLSWNKGLIYDLKGWLASQYWDGVCPICLGLRCQKNSAQSSRRNPKARVQMIKIDVGSLSNARYELVPNGGHPGGPLLCQFTKNMTKRELWRRILLAQCPPKNYLDLQNSQVGTTAAKRIAGIAGAGLSGAKLSHSILSEASSSLMGWEAQRPRGSARKHIGIRWQKCDP